MAKSGADLGTPTENKIKFATKFTILRSNAGSESNT